MPCYFPLKGYREAKSGKLKFKRSSHEDDFLTVPCGQCIGCRARKARDWSIRCMHESEKHTNNSFITLTYNKDHCPPELIKRDLQLFFKRLRKQISPIKIRYYAVGEYGSKTFRPHYHALIFGWFPEDYQFFKVKRGVTIYRSPILEKLWKYGYSTVGKVTLESASYCARYTYKKINGEMAQAHYRGKEPEFSLMSRRNGIGRDWIDKNMEHVYEFDYIIHKGKKIMPPRYYDKVYDEEYDLQPIREERAKKARENPISDERLKELYICHKARKQYRHTEI